jgi:hypothetical protein
MVFHIEVLMRLRFLTQLWYISLLLLVLLLPKINSPFALFDFRQISILPVLSKGIERILYGQLVGYLESNSLLSQFKTAFRRFSQYSVLLDLSKAM